MVAVAQVVLLKRGISSNVSNETRVNTIYIHRDSIQKIVEAAVGVVAVAQVVL